MPRRWRFGGERQKDEAGWFSRISRLAGSFSQPGRTKFQREPVKFWLGRTKFRLELDARTLELVKGGSELAAFALELVKGGSELDRFYLG